MSKHYYHRVFKLENKYCYLIYSKRDDTPVKQSQEEYYQFESANVCGVLQHAPSITY